MRSLLFASVLSIATCLSAQTSVDVGLALDGGALGLFGQFCGPVTCVPISGPVLAPGTTHAMTQSGAAATPFALAIGLPTTGCTALPGIANGLLLGAPIAVIAVGVTGPPLPVAFGLCPRGQAILSLTIPANAPTGFSFVLQSVGVDWQGQLAFSNAIAANT